VARAPGRQIRRLRTNNQYEMLLELIFLTFVSWSSAKDRPAYVHEKIDESNEPFYSAFNIPFVNDYATHLAYDIAIAVNATVTVASAVLTRIPGHRFVTKYIKASHQNDPGRTIVEVLLFVFMLAYILRQRKRNKNTGTVSRLTTHVCISYCTNKKRKWMI
jgi:hypothetical protein